MRVSSVIPFLIVIAIGLFEIVDIRAGFVEANRPKLSLIDLYGGESRITVRYVELANGRNLAVPMYVKNDAKADATNVTVELEYLVSVENLIVPGEEAKLSSSSPRAVIVHHFDSVQKDGNTIVYDWVDESKLSEARGDSLRVKYRISCDEVDEIFEGDLIVLLTPKDAV